MRYVINSLLIFLWLAYPVYADVPLIPINFSGHYDFTLSGVPFGQMDIEFAQTATHYTATSDISTVGIARIFVEHTSHTTASGRGQNFTYDNTIYESHYKTRKKPKHVKWTKKENRFLSEIIEPPDNRAVRPAVPSAQKSTAIDPLALILAARIQLIKCIKSSKKTFSLDAYDGRRLTRAEFTLLAEKIIHLGDKKYPVYQLSARRIPIAGFTKKELASIAPDEPELKVYFSHDERLVPLRLELPMMFGVASATLKF